MNQAQESAGPQRKTANCDQEAWVQDRILTAMNMAIAMHKAQRVRADSYSFDYGLRGIAEGTALEVIRTLGMEPAGVNIRVDKPTENISNLGKIVFERL